MLTCTQSIYCSYQREALLSVGLSITDRNTDAQQHTVKEQKRRLLSDSCFMCGPEQLIHVLM